MVRVAVEEGTNTKGHRTSYVLPVGELEKRLGDNKSPKVLFLLATTFTPSSRISAKDSSVDKIGKCFSRICLIFLKSTLKDPLLLVGILIILKKYC